MNDFIDTYEEHLRDSAPCASRWDGFCTGDNSDPMPYVPSDGYDDGSNDIEF